MIKYLTLCFEHTEEQKLALNTLWSKPQIGIDGVIIEAWRAISFFEDERSGKLYHLHPELVHEKNEDEGYYIYLCSRCHTSIDKDPPKKIIAARVDFGWFHQIRCLAPLNLQEEK